MYDGIVNTCMEGIILSRCYPCRPIHRQVITALRFDEGFLYTYQVPVSYGIEIRPFFITSPKMLMESCLIGMFCLPFLLSHLISPLSPPSPALGAAAFPTLVFYPVPTPTFTCTLKIWGISRRHILYRISAFKVNCLDIL